MDAHDSHFTILLLADQIGSLFGPRFLLNLYIAGAISGSIFYLAHKALTAPSFKVISPVDDENVDHVLQSLDPLPSPLTATWHLFLGYFSMWT